MAVRVVQVVGGPTEEKGEVLSSSRVVTVVSRTTEVNNTTGGTATQVVKPGGTVVNVSYGDTLPPNPSEGQIFILTS